MIDFTSGDLFHSEAEYIAQGVAEGNQEGLGTGLALEISKKWPDVQQQFKKHARSGRFRGGQIWVSEPTSSHPGIIYLATQPDMVRASLSYLRKALRSLRKWAEHSRVPSVALPKVGAGLGKLSWEKDVKPVLIDVLNPSTSKFVVYEDYVPGDGAKR